MPLQLAFQFPKLAKTACGASSDGHKARPFAAIVVEYICWGGHDTLRMFAHRTAAFVCFVLCLNIVQFRTGVGMLCFLVLWSSLFCPILFSGGGSLCISQMPFVRRFDEVLRSVLL